MTWDNMSHEVKQLGVLLTNTKNEVIGFSLVGKTYDGDGNCQDENGTNMDIIFNNTEQMKNILALIVSLIFHREQQKGLGIRREVNANKS